MTQGAALLAEEFFDNADPRFLDTFREAQEPARVAALTDRWVRDPRPWAREQALAYFALPLSCDGHHPVLKRWLRHSEEAGDAELMGVLMVACDGLVRRELTRFGLRTPSDAIRPGLEFDRARQDWRPAFRTGGEMLYSYHTRYYLRRRAWRWFRRLGFQKPGSYIDAVGHALRRYTDQGLRDGAAILDSWGLLHACFFKSPVLRFDASRAHVVAGRRLAELEPAPAFPDLWAGPDAVGPLVGLVAGAASRLVRVWATKLLREHHAEALKAFDVERFLALLDHDDDEVQQFGAACLEGHGALATLPLDRWLGLLGVRNPLALERICNLMAAHVRPDRLDDAQCVDLACSRPTAVARLGLSFLESRGLEDPELLAKLAAAKCEATGAAVAEFALERLGKREAWDGDVCSRFLDSLNRSMRIATWKWVLADPRASRDAGLFARLTETPHDDLRFRLVDELERRAALPGLRGDALVPVWASVLLGVHRGGRRKPKAVRQLADAVSAEPERADDLLPVLCIAVRSVRPPERAAGLAGVATVLTRRPDLAGRVTALLPGLSLAEAGEDAS